ncbi:Hypothetical predicted protein [Olea europaea subsp. europaea]|uniref:Uncharacterized protein n=1 Tax=Olea europaea subsp. europaea TaxID=158383 RepID=A0A8S0RWT2_OLEEU|nr:Hypothetical predicted protein [Olea europaea subsp. europaea]
MQFLGHGVQAMFGMRRGHSLILRHFWEISVHDVQGMSGYGVKALFWSHPSRGKAVAYFPGFYRQFLGHGVHAMSMTRSYLGYVLAMLGMQIDFQAHAGRGRDTA